MVSRKRWASRAGAMGLVMVGAMGIAASGAGADVGSLKVSKQVTDGVGPDAGVFSFTGSWGESFDLAAGASKVTELEAGSYELSEEKEPGYKFLGMSCSGPTGTINTEQPSIRAEVVAGQETACLSRSQPIIDISVEPEVTGNARLKVKRSCREPNRLVAWVVAGNARRVSFRLNGRWVKTVRRPVRGDVFRTVQRVSSGRVRVSARVVFVAGASPSSARLSKTVGSCRSPAYTGGAD